MNTQFSTTPLPYLRCFAGLFAFILPICLALAQSTPVASPVVYTGTDFSANVTAGPVVDVKQLASKSPGPAGSAGGETHFNRFPKAAAAHAGHWRNRSAIACHTFGQLA